MRIKYLGLILPLFIVATAQASFQEKEDLDNNEIYLKELSAFKFYDSDEQNNEL